ncbi:GNAT family N-acetyltransferase [Spirochaeta thermophila]|uniref:N-acetyltransferase domain-containing protein n=1 Tax=Winmispira thermophila (strain ATCC 49972 / DSM 6192 / RI 19.B1) TaxID=665571 RepID=E0RRK7_WINT6|nr:GNAT family N-acetyltransferase [Spirochaeta thermophila]ADN01708.1 hypothetical protein STHERM_c07570 [Spirochaeta thermophila DSM 6192]
MSVVPLDLRDETLRRWVTDILTQREWECVYLSSRTLVEAEATPGRRLWGIFRGRRLGGVILLDHGSLFPYLPEVECLEPEEEAALRSHIRREGNRCLGLLSEVEKLLPLFASPPEVLREYDLMLRTRTSPPPEPAVPLVIRPALASDIPALYQLQEGYEKEEVLYDPRLFSPLHCFATIRHLLRDQLLYLACTGDTIVAKAGTNARGLTVDQVGGVYTLPAWRGKRIAQALVHTISRTSETLGKKVCLFVRKGHTIARHAYEKVGFEVVGEFGIAYF